MYLKKYTSLLLLSILILASCAPQKRLNRLIKHHPELAQSYTVIKTDTILTEHVSTDTIFNYFSKDTVIVKEGLLTMKYFYNSHDSTVYLRGECATDTIFKETIVQVNNIQAHETGYDKFKNFVMGNIISLLILLGVVYFIFNSRK